jgi:hypothetical protein
MRQIFLVASRFQKSDTLRRLASVVKGMKVLRVGYVFRDGSCCQVSLQKRVEVPLCSSQKRVICYESLVVLGRIPDERARALTIPPDELPFRDCWGVFFPPKMHPKVLRYF